MKSVRTGHPVKPTKRPIAISIDVWEALPISPRVKRAYEQTGNVIPVDISNCQTPGQGP